MRTSGPQAGLAVVSTLDLAGPKAPAASGTGYSLRLSGREGTCGRATAAELADAGRGAVLGGGWRVAGGGGGVRWAAPSDVYWGGSGFLSGLGWGPWAGWSHCFSAVLQPSLVGAHGPQGAWCGGPSDSRGPGELGGQLSPQWSPLFPNGGFVSIP